MQLEKYFFRYIYSWGGGYKPCISPLKILRSGNQLNYKTFDKLRALLSNLSKDQLDGSKLLKVFHQEVQVQKSLQLSLPTKNRTI